MEKLNNIEELKKLTKIKLIKYILFYYQENTDKKKIQQDLLKH